MLYDCIRQYVAQFLLDAARNRTLGNRREEPILAKVIPMTDSEQGEASLVARIEADLIGGNFRPGEWLKQADVEESYSANRFDVRMALLDLKARQLIEHIPNRGFRVINLSEREREALFETRVILETAAARLAAARISDDTIEELEAIVLTFRDHMETADQDYLRALNGQFHDLLYQSSGNPVLAEEIKALRQRGLPGTRGGLRWRTMAGIQHSHDEHVKMIELLRARDGEALAATIDEHLNGWRRYLP